MSSPFGFFPPSPGDYTTGTPGYPPAPSAVTSAEDVRDIVGAQLRAGVGAQVVVDDNADTITISATGGGGGSLTVTSTFTSGSHTPVSGELAVYNPSSNIGPALPAAAAGQRFGIANVAALSSTAVATFTCVGPDTFSDGATSIALAPGERAVLVGRSGGFTIESRFRRPRLSEAMDVDQGGASVGTVSALRKKQDGTFELVDVGPEIAGQALVLQMIGL